MTGTLLGFDFGLRRIGVAVGNSITGEARPVRTIANRNDGPDWSAIDTLVADWSPAALVVGVPYNEHHGEQTIVVAAEEFGRQLAERFGLPVHHVDEHLSSFAAGEALVERRQRGDHKRLRSGDLDAAAAAVILTDWLKGNPST